MSLPKTAKNWLGYKYGDAVVTEYLGGSTGRTKWMVDCVCGKRTPRRPDSIQNGIGAKCGHLINPTSPEDFKKKNHERYLRDRGLWLVRASTKRTSADRTPRYRYSKGKANAKFRRIAWELTLADYEPLCVAPCFYCDGKLGKTEKGTGLDRLDSTVGYTSSNVVPCCTQCNRIKGDGLTPAEAKAAVEAVIKIRFQ